MCKLKSANLTKNLHKYFQQHHDKCVDTYSTCNVMNCAKNKSSCLSLFTLMNENNSNVSELQEFELFLQTQENK